MKHYDSKQEHTKLMRILFTLLIVMSFVMGSSCTLQADVDEDKIPADGPVQFEVLRSFMSEHQVVSCRFRENIAPDATNYESNSSHGLSRLELIIDSQAEFDSYISCNDTVNINFEEEYILAGMTRYQPNQIYIQEHELEVKNDSIFFRVRISNSIWTSPSRAEYIIKVTSRDYIEYPVVFDVYWKGEK